MQRGRPSMKTRQAVIKLQRAFRARRMRRFRPVRYRGKQKPLALATHNFCERSTIEDNMVIGSSTPLLKEWSLNEIAQSGEYINLFDEYKINKVVVTFRYKGASSIAIAQSGNAVNEMNPVLYFQVDHNDGITKTLDELKKSSKTKEFQFTNDKPNFDVVVKPSVLVNVNNIEGAIGTHYRPKWGVWLPSEENSIGHYGLKAYARCGSGGGTSSPGSISVTYKIYFSTKCNE